MGTDIRVLHVDDDPDFVDVTSAFLEKTDDDLTVTTATHVTDAHDILDREDVDCILSDYDMPDQDGIDFLKSIRENHPDLPFLLYTGKGSEEVASQAISMGVTDYMQKAHGQDHVDLLVNRIRNAAESYRTTRRAANLDRLRTLAADINQVLVRASSRGDVEQSVCDVMSDSDPYVFAWIGTHTPDTDLLEPRTKAGIDNGYLDLITDPDAAPTTNAHRPGHRALEDREIAVSQDIQDDPAFSTHVDAATDRGYRSVAGVPLFHDDSVYGVLLVYADRAHAFDDDERALLTELGDDIAHAISAQETRTELETTKNRYQALFENAASPVLRGEILQDPKQRVIRAINPAFQEVFGFEPEDVVGRDVRDVIVPESEHEEHQQFREQIGNGESVTAKAERTTVNGPKMFLLQITPYGQNNGAGGGWFAWYTDINRDYPVVSPQTK